MNFPVVPEQMALINVHLQNCFVRNHDHKQLVERVNHFAAICRAANMLVVHTRSIWRADGANAGVFAEIYPPGKEIFRSDACQRQHSIPASLSSHRILSWARPATAHSMPPTWS